MYVTVYFSMESSNIEMSCVDYDNDTFLVNTLRLAKNLYIQMQLTISSHVSI